MWLSYDELAMYKENKEFNTQVNMKWKSCVKSNGRKLWKLIDWNDTLKDDIHATVDPKINSYFTN